MHAIALERGASLASDEVCPLCLARYAGADESICTVCEAPSCPDCATLVPDSAEVCCYACHGPTKH